MSAFRDKLFKEQKSDEDDNFIPLSCETPKSVLDRFSSKKKLKV